MLHRLATYLRGRKLGLRSPAQGETTYAITVAGTAHQVQHSSFNSKWLDELGITPKTIIDLGAYDGGDAWRFKRDFPQCRVISVEADPERVEIVREILRETDAEVLNVAACDTDGPIEWFSATIDGTREAQGSIYRHSEAYKKKFPFVDQTDKPQMVTGQRFSTLCAENAITGIDLLHMDVEGAEHTVLETLGDIRPRLIYMEWRSGFFVGNKAGLPLEKLLADMGYQLILRLSADRLYMWMGD